MKKTLEIIRYELVSAFRRTSFLFVAFGIPIIAVLIFAGISLFKTNNSTSGAVEQDQPSTRLETEGYVDLAGLISFLPNDIPEGVLIPFSSEEAAKLAMESDAIEAYYVIPEDYVETGNLIYVHPKVNPIAEGGQNWVMIWTLYFNLLDGNMALASDVWSPANYVHMDLSEVATANGSSSGECSTPGYRCESNALIQLLPIGVMAIIYIYRLSLVAVTC